jgi:hypothetical protein
MLAVDVQSTLEQALVFYQKHLESLREQQENNLPRNGKARATTEDLSIERAFDERLQVVATLLDSTEENPEQTIQQVKRPPVQPPPPPRKQTVQPKIFDEFDTEPYLNPFTGQLITPETPFTAGSSTSHINANVERWETHGPRVNDHIQQQKTASVLQRSFPQSPKPNGPITKSSAEPDMGRSRPPSYKSVESVRSFDTRSVVPAARSYASQQAVPEAVPLSKSRWGTISRLKRMGTNASFKAGSKNQAEGRQKHGMGNASPDIHDAAVTDTSMIGSLAKSTDVIHTETLQHLDQHRQARNLEPTTSYGHTSFLQNVPGFGRYGSAATSNQPTIESKPPPPSIIRHEPPGSTSDISIGTQRERRQCPTITETPPKSIRKLVAPEMYPNNAPTPVKHARTSPVQSQSAASEYHAINNGPHQGTSRAKQSMEVPRELPRSFPAFQASVGWTEQAAGERHGNAVDPTAFTLYEESQKLALELSAGFPQDYASLKQIQEEHEISAQMLESQRVALELAGDSPQDYAAFNGLQAEHESTLENLRLADIERQNAFEADRRLAQSLAAEEDVPQQIEEFHRVDGQRQLELQEEAKKAREIAEREDRAEMEAQVAMARRLQAEWNTSDANAMAEQQRLAREVAEEEDRLELDRRNAELQRLQAERGRPELTQWTNDAVAMSSPPVDADTLTGDRPPPYTAQAKPEGKPSGRKPRTRPSHPQREAPSNAASSQDAEELSRIIAERRARHGQWEADVKKANQAAKEAEEAIRKRAREEEEEIRRLEQQQRLLADKARKEEEARRAAIEAERRARQADCTVCAETAEKSNMAILSCNHAYCGGCVSRKSRPPPLSGPHTMSFSLLTMAV